MARSRGADALSRLLGATLAAAAALGAGCMGHDPYRPGEPIGLFRVTAQLVSSSCGQAPSPWQFDVRLRHDHATLYWVQGGAPIAGQVDAGSRAVLKSNDARTVRAADARTKTAACTISREDLLDVVLAPAAGEASKLGAATSFKGSLSYRFAPVGDSSCEDQLAEAGGDFAALPCSVGYELAAVRTGDAP